MQKALATTFERREVPRIDEDITGLSCVIVAVVHHG
jgi:hypothetical protein